MNISTYIQFIAKNEKVWAGMPSRQRQILQIVYKQDLKIQLQVQDLLSLKEIGSQATIHSDISKLVADKYLKLTPSKIDARVKFVTLASKGSTLFSKLEKLTQVSAKATRAKELG